MTRSNLAAILVGAMALVALYPAPAPAQGTFNQQPGAELKGLTKLGIVVEDLSPQAAACGLK